MAGETASDTADAEEEKTWVKRLLHEVRETGLTIAVFVPFWLVFSTFVYELRSIPSESMVPALQVGDRVAVSKFAYGYDRNSAPFGIGRWFIGDDPDDPDERWMKSEPNRGDVIVFQHPNSNRVMIKRLIGLPGDRVQMRNGRLYLNGEEVAREEVRRVTYVQSDRDRMPVTAIEYSEQLPGEDEPHLIHEFSNTQRLDWTPIFTVPQGHVFMMGDNRDNSEDSRAPSGHPGMAEMFAEGWRNASVAPTDDPAIGFVPMDHLIGRADTVLFTLHRCRKAPGTECAAPRLWRGL